MEKAAAKPPLPHDLILESRSRLTVTGVQRVLHCSAESAALETGKGILHLSGAQISMQTLDLEAGEAKLTGRFDGLEYTAARAAGSFLAPAAALMVQVLLPARLLQEAAACAVLGAALGAVRAFLPARGRAAFVPDVLLSGVVLLVCQSYAAGYSAAGVLRWYMVLAAFAAALCTAGVLGVPLRALGRGIGAALRLPGRILHRFAVQPVRRRAAAKTARKLRRNAERTAKKSKKNLPNQRALLYNSNVSK
ncbi:MAG: YabP/YqfC family sporulation protein [Faecalibacterium prausnitzii]